jgi:hypothetical protein
MEVTAFTRAVTGKGVRASARSGALSLWSNVFLRLMSAPRDAAFQTKRPRHIVVPAVDVGTELDA